MPTQSEQTLENELVDQLVAQGHERVKVEDEASLLANLKTQLEAFNGVTLTDSEFGKVMNHLTRSNAVFEKAKILRDWMALEREDGETVYLDFLDENQLERNLFEVTPYKN
ncbi:type I restriction endonuclease [Rubritalea marina]|uniref:type I restriction endonuclease n=1 Tax=Rubritalea marina TaxID=361055 RepID=UPI0003809AED|nr:type I restriction endonuclease [Rubritalea marina]